jgi:tripartite-type tricarboxylate transporter receptor subunit TctC
MSNPLAHTARRAVLRLASLAVLAAPALLGSGLVTAQEFPSRPIKLVVGYPPGGSNDIVARIIAPRLGEALNTQVIVENKAGVSGVIGADFVAKAAPDGYTLFAASASPVVITPHTIAKIPFNTLTDFAPINTVGLTPEAIAVRPALGVTSLKELLKVVAREDVRAQLLMVAVTPSVMASPDAFQRFVGEEFNRWGKLVKEKNIVTTD